MRLHLGDERSRMSTEALYYTALIGPSAAKNPDVIAYQTKILLQNLYRLAEKKGLDIIEDSIQPSTMPWGTGVRLIITADTKERA